MMRCAADSRLFLSPSGTVAIFYAQNEVKRTLVEEQAHTLRGKDTLHHREALQVVAARDAELVALEVLAEGLSID